MLISVVIPTCHRNDLLARCLERLAPGGQTLAADQYEVIVTDDGSKSTAELMMRERFPWARWTAGPRRGPAANRNHGVRQASGKWIAFTDDDCVPGIDWLESYRAAIRDGVLAYEGKTACHAGVKRFEFDAAINLFGGIVPSCNLLINRHLYDRMAGFDEHFPHPSEEDTDFRERLRRDGHWPLFVPGAIVDHPPRPRMTGSALGRHWESRVYYCKKWGSRSSFRFWLPVFAAKVRLSQMLHEHRLRDWPTALASMTVEIFYVLTHVRGWESKYRYVTPLAQVGREASAPTAPIGGSRLADASDGRALATADHATDNRK